MGFATGAKRGRAAWLPGLTALMLVALFTGLGVWQVERAGDKRAVLAALEADAGQPAAELAATADLKAQAYRRVAVRGRFLERQFLLDNRLFQGRAGFDVLTPLVLADGRVILVDRGWVPAGPGREPTRPVAAPSDEPVTVTGRLWLPQEGIALGPAIAPESEPGWPRLTTRVAFPALAAALGRDLVPAVIRARGEAAWLYRPRPLEPAFGPARHYGYALQWFALALTVLVISAWAYWRRRRPDPEET
jgi:surfeit locus 1 family protein